MLMFRKSCFRLFLQISALSEKLKGGKRMYVYNKQIPCFHQLIHKGQLSLFPANAKKSVTYKHLKLQLINMSSLE